MNPETRRFEPITPTTPGWWARFTVGETLELKGWLWRVASCDRSELRLEFAGKPKRRRVCR